MTKEKFKKRFIAAINKAINETKKFVINDLPYEAVINLYSRDKKEINLRLNIDDAIEKIYVDGKIPKWVNVNVVKSNGVNTIIECDYSDIFVDNDNLLQFHNEPLSPFNLVGPYLPSDWKGVEKSGKFKLLDYDEDLGQLVLL